MKLHPRLHSGNGPLWDKTSLAIAMLCGTTLASKVVAQEEQAPAAADGPWISSVAWMNDDEIVASKSQGLLLQPAQVVKAMATEPESLAVMGESETSLWRVLALDSRVIATDYKGGIHVFGGGDPATIKAEVRWIRALSPTPAEDKILAGTEDGKLVVLSMGSLAEEKRIDAHEAGAIFDIAFSPDGKTVATAGSDGKIKLFTWPELNAVGEMSRGDETIWSLAFSLDGSQIISGGADRRIQLWDVAKKQSVCTICTTHDWITDMVAIPDSQLVVAGCMDGQLVAADYKLLTKVAELDAAKSSIWSIALNSDNSRLAIGTRKHGLLVKDFSELQQWKQRANQLAEESSKIRPPRPTQAQGR